MITTDTASPAANLCRALRVSRENKLGLATLHALTFLVEQGGQARLTDIAEELGISTSAVTGVVDQLEKLKLAGRSFTALDRRSIFAVITAKGREAAEACLKPYAPFPAANAAQAVPTLGLRFTR